MAIMAMDTVKKTKLAAIISTSLLIQPIVAGEWLFAPKIIVDETYTDNVELTLDSKQLSLVSQTGVGIDSSYNSQYLNFNFDSNSVYAMYSHNHDLDNDYHTLNGDLSLKLGDTGFSLIGDADIYNRSKNSTRNALADIVSADTVRVETYIGGLAYHNVNSQFKIDTDIKYHLSKSEDDIGNFEGYSANFLSNNGSSSYAIFWHAAGQYQELKNNGQTSLSYQGEIKLGAITSWKINPFVRYFDEDNTGTVNTGQSTESNSYGMGLRWLISPKLFIDASYNYPIGTTLDLAGEKQTNYVDLSVNWQPSVRTSLKANYSQRFFGDTYGLNLSHKNKRLTNEIKYEEVMKSFTRNNYELVSLGNFWCPDNSNNINLNNCFVQDGQDIDFDNFQLFNMQDFLITEDNVFSLYKNLSWHSELSFARSTFQFNAEHSDRENLSDNNEDERTSVTFLATRKLTKISNIELDASYTDNWWRKGSENERRERYRKVAFSYTKSINSKLLVNISLAHVNRSSDAQQYNYEEGRVTFKITKDF